MGRKRFIKLPEVATIMCRNCGQKSKRRVPEDASPQYFDCDKCGQRMQTPINACCIICAFTKKKCVPSLIMEARAKSLTIKN